MKRENKKKILDNLQNDLGLNKHFSRSPCVMDLQETILALLDKNQVINDTKILKFSTELVASALKSLASKEMVKFTILETEQWKLTEEGRDICENGSHEVKVFKAIAESMSGLSISDLKEKVGQCAQLGQNKAFKNKWISKTENNMLIKSVDSVIDTVQVCLQEIANTNSCRDDVMLQDLKKRKLVEKQKIQSFKVEKGDCFSLKVEKYETDLTQALLQSGDWKKATFKKYNFAAEGANIASGHLHPLLKVRQEFRKIFLELGFEEMPTNCYVESSFWNFDSLFQPQQHPARDAHDTFFLKDPMYSDDAPKDYLEKVKRMHSSGGMGSIGHKYDWKQEESQKNILRTHTTAVSSRMLYKLAQEKEFRPVKYFSLDKVFRNESLDATHLAEFHQIEGLIADYNLTLGDLIGVLNEFFKKLGMDKLRFKPAYNPYTEPSMEIFAFHEGLNKWIEVGNSGIFRPEMLRPMGFDENVSVIAWGLSVERPTMIKYGISNIRDLVGHKVDLEMIKNNSICRLDK